ncbi:MAG: transposase [Verrucomicrobium sp.]
MDPNTQHTPWPHAPPHRLDAEGTFFVTGSTYQKEKLFHGEARLELLHHTLLRIAFEHRWLLEAWAVFPNHYHFIARPQCNADKSTARPIGEFIAKLHSVTARELNLQDATPGRKVWHNYWDTRLTYENSYISRLTYVHNNPVKHGLVLQAREYPWCSAAWFERTASKAWLKTVASFKTDRLKIDDDF